MSWITNLFKKKESVPERMEIIFRRELELRNMFIGPGDYRPLTIVTYVVKRTNRRGNVSYEIKQELPLTSDPFYDGDFVTNKTLERYGKSEHILAQEAIDKDKIACITKGTEQ